ncbi:hypothetical protein ACVIGB_001061 [Bradyrhizobium sp. USDA 4341]
MTSKLRSRPIINFPTSGLVQAVTVMPTRVRLVDDRGVHDISLKEASEDGTSAIIWRRAGKDEIELFNGDRQEATAAFDDFADRMGRLLDQNQAPIAEPAKKSYLWGAMTVGAILAVGCINGAVFYSMRDRAQPPVDDARLATLENLTRQLQGLGIPDSPPGSPPSTAAKPVKTVTVPTGLIGGAPNAPAAADTAAVRAGVVIVPKDLPPLPAQPPAAETTKVSAPVTDATPAKAPPEKASVTIESNAPSTEISMATDLAAAEEPSKVPSKEASKETSKPAEKAADKPAEPADEAKEATAKKDPLRGMNATEAQELLRQLEEIKTMTADGSELPVELLRKLPSEVAARLVGTGIATVSPQDRKERAQKQARIVRLPASIINQYRDRTGIASIPESDSWVANGGRVSIPLPGGGDITSPDVMTQFGLKP